MESTPHRVRSLIRFLNYTELRKDKVLPKEALFTKVPRGGKFPKIAQKMGYADFGLFMENIVREAVMCHEEELMEVFERCREYVPEEYRDFYNPKDYVEIGETLRESFLLEDIPAFEPEWPSISDNIIGHPDVVTGNCVYDIKTTGKFGSMRTQVLIPQVLCYYALAHINGYTDITSVGTILPAQRLVLKVDLKGWDWKPFWEKVVGCISLKMEHSLHNSLPLAEYAEFQGMLRGVGYHVEKSSLKEAIARGFPTQFFIGGRVSTKITSLPKELSLFLKNRFPQPIFIHSPYTINLSNPHGKFKKAGDEELELPWACDALVKILKTGEKSGLNGVVVHCGKRGGMAQKDALVGMYDSLCLVAPHISEESGCPLLLETSSGQSGELLYDPDEFADFYLSLPLDVRSKIKICVDTCHVFAAGFDPMEFIEVLESKNIPIALIHYNDSKVPKGSKKDRHARIGQGYIGLQSLFKFLVWANKHDIPCVHE